MTALPRTAIRKRFPPFTAGSAISELKGRHLKGGRVNSNDKPKRFFIDGKDGSRVELKPTKDQSTDDSEAIKTAASSLAESAKIIAEQHNQKLDELRRLASPFAIQHKDIDSSDGIRRALESPPAIVPELFSRESDDEMEARLTREKLIEMRASDKASEAHQTEKKQKSKSRQQSNAGPSTRTLNGWKKFSGALIGLLIKSGPNSNGFAIGDRVNVDKLKDAIVDTLKAQGINPDGIGSDGEKVKEALDAVGLEKISDFLKKFPNSEKSSKKL